METSRPSNSADNDVRANKNDEPPIENDEPDKTEGDQNHHLRAGQESGIFIKGKVETMPIEWLVDTGCTITIVNTRLFDAIHPDEQPRLIPYHGKLTSVDGSSVKVKGQALMNIQIGTKLLQHTALVADVTNQGIIGLDFLQKHQMILDCARNKLTCDGQEVKAYCRAGTHRACRVSVTEHTIIPAGSRTVLQAKTSKPLADGSWLVEPLSRAPGNKPVLTAKVLVRGCGTTLPVEILNPTEEDVCLYKYTNLGIVSRVADSNVVCSIQTQLSKNNSAELHGQSDSLPPEVEKIVENIDVDLTKQQKFKIRQLLHKNENIFATKEQPFGRTDLVKHKIVTSTEMPIKQPVRRPPFHLRGEAQKEVDRMLDHGVIEPSESPWASPVVLVRKKDGSLRYCIDYRKLNSITRKDSYPLPRIDESLDSLAEMKYFSTLDLASGYWQIGLDEDAKMKSAFCTPNGLYQFKVMPFGLTNAPATFQRLMERILTGLHWQTCLVYIDDIIIFSETFDEHIDHLSEVFARLQSAGLKLKPKKCSIFKTEVAYLGHIVSRDGISTDPEKTKTVENWSTPQTASDVRSFLGLCSYYRRFVPDFATIAKPLTRLTEKNVPFVWSSEEEESWLKLKKLLTSAPVMAYPDSRATFILDTDASQVGIGAVLSQLKDGEEKVIAYGSRVLTKPERQYCITRRELLAVVYFVKYFRHYLYGKKFLLRTDHASLRWIRNFKEPEGQLARWLEVLDTYDFTLEHRPGAKHGNADAMSRGPCAQCEMDHEGQKPRRGRRPYLPENVLRPVQTRGRTKTQPSTVTNWLPPTTLSQDEIVKAQQADPLLSEVTRWVNDGKRPDFGSIAKEGTDYKFYWGQFDCLKIVGGILIRELDLPDSTIKRQICLPPSMYEEALKSCHSATTAGHFGRGKTHANVKYRFLWPGMRRSVNLFVMACDVCAAYKTDGKKRRAEMKSHVTGVPMERICLDIVGPFPESRNGNKYGLVVTDYFTKYVEVYAIPNQEASTIATVLTREFFSRYGVPNFLHSDQGTQFESKLFAEVCTLLGITKTRTTPFRPQSDGQSERNIKTLSRMIAMATKDQHDWDEHLPFLSMAYRATPQDSTGLTPNFLMYGRELSMPVDVMIGPPQDQPMTELEYVKKMQKKLTYAYGLARMNLKKAAERQSKYYNKFRHGVQFNLGDLCWYANKLRKKGVSPKLQPKWRGPCLVTKKFTDTLVHIQVSAKKSLTVHTDLLKPCHSPRRPRWLKRAQNSLLRTLG